MIKIPIISPVFTFVQKAFLLGLFSGELKFEGFIFGRAHFGGFQLPEFYVIFYIL